MLLRQSIVIKVFLLELVLTTLVVVEQQISLRPKFKGTCNGVILFSKFCLELSNLFVVVEGLDLAILCSSLKAKQPFVFKPNLFDLKCELSNLYLLV